MKTRMEWEGYADSLSINGLAFVNGEYTPAESGETFDCISPVDGRLLTKVASCQQADADKAVKNARDTFSSGVWAHLPPAERKKVMIRFADLIEQNGDELALLETLDMGKPIRYSKAVDVFGAARAIRWSGEAVDKIYDELAPTPHNEIGMVTREPVGVVAAIVPWNFPMLMACWKLGPALASGNSVILKPSEKSPLSAIRLAQIAIEAGIPKGVLNVLPVTVILSVRHWRCIWTWIPGVYRLHQNCQTTDDLCRAVEHEACLAGSRRQEPECRVCRCTRPESRRRIGRFCHRL